MKQHANAKFTEAQRFEIYKRVKDGEKQVDVAAEYNVHPSTITGIVNDGIDRELELFRTANRFKTK